MAFNKDVCISIKKRISFGKIVRSLIKINMVADCPRFEMFMVFPYYERPHDNIENRKMRRLSYDIRKDIIKLLKEKYDFK